MPDPTPQTTSETPVAQPTPQSPEPQVSPQAQNRQQIYQQYYSQQPNPTDPTSAVSDVVDGQVQDPTAQVGSPQPEPVQTPPDPTLELVRSLQAEIAALKQQVAPKPPEPTPTPQPKLSQRFTEKLKAGDVDGAIDDLAASIRAEVENDLRQKLVPEAQSKAVEQVWLEREVEKFVNTLRAENPDLVPMEELISVKANAYLEEAQKAGKITSSADFLREYQAAVTKAKDDTKTIVQQIRGAGVQQAMTTKQTVLSSQPVPPNPIQRNPQPTQAEPTNDPRDYLARRMARNMELRGISPQPN